MRNPSDRDAQIVNFANTGLPYAKIADLYGITRQRVGQIAKDAGVIRQSGAITRARRLARIKKAEAKLHNALLYHLPDDPETIDAMERLSATIRELIKAKVPA
jgi:DNA-binding Lrp family transcriptional regulator